MHLIVTDIQWDTEGETAEACALPENVVVLDAPANMTFNDLDNGVSEVLSDAFGFCHQGFSWEQLTSDHYTHAGGGIFPKHLALCRFPQ